MGITSVTVLLQNYYHVTITIACIIQQRYAIRWPELATHNILTSSSVRLGSSIILGRLLHLVTFKARAHVICPFQHVFFFSSSFQKASTFYSATIRFHMKCCVRNNCRNSIQLACTVPRSG